jgi:glutaredoxin
LRRAGLAFQEINIWDDPDAAAFVRSVADGNETVPTVVVGGAQMVNPSARRVRAVASESNGRPRPTGRRWFHRRSRS